MAPVEVRHQPVEEPEQRGLARPRRARDEQELALLHAQRELAQSRANCARIAVGNALNGDNVLHVYSVLSPRIAGTARTRRARAMAGSSEGGCMRGNG